MIVVAKKDHIEIREPDDFGRFHVENANLPDSGFASLLELGLGLETHTDPSRVWVHTDVLRDLLDTNGNAARAEGLRNMLAYADSKGWLSTDGTRVAAHVEKANH